LRVAKVIYVDEASMLVAFDGVNEHVVQIKACLHGVCFDLIEPGDNVVVAGQDEDLFLFGRITPLRQEPDRIPHRLVLEANEALTLRVGDGSITIREDGKILIKGKDLVSHAKRMNRIRGGSVTIN
jgi:archaeosine-15-forming tRNA-guanine transglycosylase